MAAVGFAPAGKLTLVDGVLGPGTSHVVHPDQTSTCTDTREKYVKLLNCVDSDERHLALVATLKVCVGSMRNITCECSAARVEPELIRRLRSITARLFFLLLFDFFFPPICFPLFFPYFSCPDFIVPVLFILCLL